MDIVILLSNISHELKARNAKKMTPVMIEILNHMCFKEGYKKVTGKLKMKRRPLFFIESLFESHPKKEWYKEQAREVLSNIRDVQKDRNIITAFYEKDISEKYSFYYDNEIIGEEDTVVYSLIDKERDKEFACWFFNRNEFFEKVTEDEIAMIFFMLGQDFADAVISEKKIRVIKPMTLLLCLCLIVGSMTACTAIKKEQSPPTELVHNEGVDIPVVPPVELVPNDGVDIPSTPPIELVPNNGPDIPNG